jgi:hypothetical protein
MRFRVQRRDRLGLGELSRIYVAGAEDIPWSTRATWDGDVLVVERHVDDSGYVYVPWLTAHHGQQMLNTATLMERDEPYLLDVELARGVIQRMRSRIFLWESTGFAVNDEALKQLREICRKFSTAATRQSQLNEAGELANESLDAALSCSKRIASEYAEQSLNHRRAQSLPSTLMGVSLGPTAPPVAMRRRLLDACNLIQIPLAWRSIESREGRHDWKPSDDQLGWCQAAGLKVAGGPLLRMDDRGAPDWMVLWEGDYDNLTRLILEHVQAVVTRYAGRVHLWHVASRVNNGTLLSLSEEQRLNLVAQALHLVRKLDPRTPTVVSFDQPWAEYLAERDEDLAPIHYADALLRADLGVSGFGLEINAGYWPRGSGHRPIYEYGRLIDLWSQLGLPLMLLLSTADCSDPDPHALAHVQIEKAGPGTVAAQPGVGKKAKARPTKADPQHDWAASVAPLVLARSNVQVLLWNQLADGEPHEFPHGGLFNAAGEEKPAIGVLRELRNRFLA